MKRFSLYTGLPIRGNEGKVYPLYHQRERKKSNNLVYPPKVNDTINSPTHLFAGLTQAKVKILKGVNLSCIEVSMRHVGFIVDNFKKQLDNITHSS